MDHKKNYFSIVSFAICILILFASCTQKQELFTQISSAQTNIHFQNQLKDHDSLNILDYLYYYNGGGVATGDINNDGLPDIFSQQIVMAITSFI